jgi:cell division protein FtsW
MTTATLRMARSAGQRRESWDPMLVAIVSLLIGIGLVMVYSASVTLAERETGNSMHYLYRHSAHVLLGVTLLLLVARTRLEWWEQAGPLLLILGILLLAATLIPGVGATVNGSTRWIRFGFFNLQPSELAKLFTVVYVAGYLIRHQDQLHSFTRGILITGIVLAVEGVLLLQEPDLGTLIVLVATVMTMLFLGGVRFWHFLACIATGVGAIALLTIISPYRMERVTGFLNPWADPFDSGFQLVQALIAFGRGEWFGVGLGASIQKMFYLPAAHTDFLLAVIAEELGLFGVLAVLALFYLLVLKAFAIARAADSAGLAYGGRLAQGIGLLIGLQAMINMGVNLGVLPTKGLTLPFMSYGGSSMVVNCIAVGLLFAIARQAQRNQWRRNG